MANNHDAKTESHPIADMVIARCPCGWMERFSIWDHDNAARSAAEAALRHKRLASVTLEGVTAR